MSSVLIQRLNWADIAVGFVVRWMLDNEEMTLDPAEMRAVDGIMIKLMDLKGMTEKRKKHSTERTTK